MTKAASRSTSTASADPGPSAAQVIDAKIAGLDDWRGTTLAHVRRIIQQADPAVVETVKWRGVPVWEHDGILCTGETYARAVKLTFAKGAALDDPAGLFNASLDGNTRRAIDLHEGDTITTIEGIARGTELAPIQAAFIEHDAFQCGYCTPGQICSAVGMAAELRRGVPSYVTGDLATDTIEFSNDEVRERMSGNLCRCGAYNGIVAAVTEVNAGQPSQRAQEEA